MNKVIVSGYVTKEIKPNNTNKMANAQISASRPFPFSKRPDGKNAVDYLTLKFIGEKNVTRAAQWLVVGTPVIIEGIVCCDNWKDSEGKWQKFDYILVTSWEFQKSKRDKEDGEMDGLKEGYLPEEVNYDLPKAPDAVENTENSAPVANDGFMDIPDGIEKDLPFR